MPDRSLLPAHDPPTLYERALYHPWEIVIAITFVVVGALLLWALAVGAAIAAPIAGLPVVLAVLVPALVGNGGLAVIVALTWRGPHVNTEWLIERFGWGAAALGWGIYAVTVIDRWPHSLWTITVAACFTGGSLGRMWAVRELTHRVRAVEPIDEEVEAVDTDPEAESTA